MRLMLAASLALLACSPAAAFDCKKAATTNEKAICADPAALESDAAMSAAYSAALSSAPPPQRPALATAQSRWLKDRDSNCADIRGAALGACLVEESRKRRLFLSGQPEAGPGAPGRLAPRVRIAKGGKGSADIDVQLLEFATPRTPAERAFNAAAEKAIGDLAEPDQDDPRADNYAHSRTMQLVYASPHLISAIVSGYDDVGGAHPSSFTTGVNVDVAAGREVRFDDLFAPSAADKVFALCLKAVIAQKKEKMGADAPLDDLKDLAKSVRDATSAIGAWSFGADKATVIYDPYAVGSYAEGGYYCELPYATLRPLAKASFPLP